MTMNIGAFTFHGKPIEVGGNTLAPGDNAPNVTLVDQELKDLRIDSFRGHPLIILSIPSLDTPVCVVEARKFSDKLTQNQRIRCLLVSRDLPFAQIRWAKETAIHNIVTASDYKYQRFAEAYGCLWVERAILIRAVFAVNPSGVIVHTQYRQEVDSEPDYEAAINSLL